MCDKHEASVYQSMCLFNYKQANTIFQIRGEKAQNWPGDKALRKAFDPTNVLETQVSSFSWDLVRFPHCFAKL